MVPSAAQEDRLVTADELLRMPDDGLRRELVRGELRILPPEGRPHGKIALRIGSRLERHVSMHRLGEAYAAGTGFRLTSKPATVFRSLTDGLLLSEDDVLDGGDVVPGWKLPIRALFD